MEDSINSFIEKSRADLLTFYTRSSTANICDTDVRVICDLIEVSKRKGVNNLNILLHTLGGNINAAIGLLEFLKSQYTGDINSIVIKVAKSSGAFIALSCKDCYMHTGSVLSDFTLDVQQSTQSYTDAQRRSTELAFAGVCGKMDFKVWLPLFVFNSNPHGTPIKKADLIDYVKKFSQFHCRTKSIAHLHNEIVKKFKDNQQIKKIYGLNDNLFFSEN